MTAGSGVVETIVRAGGGYRGWGGFTFGSPHTHSETVLPIPCEGFLHSSTSGNSKQVCLLFVIYIRGKHPDVL